MSSPPARPPLLPCAGDKGGRKELPVETVVDPKQLPVYRSVIQEHVYNVRSVARGPCAPLVKAAQLDRWLQVLLPDLILKQPVDHVSQLPILKQVILHQHNDKLVSNPQAFLPVMAGIQLVSGRRPDVVQDVRKSGAGRERRTVHVPMAVVAKLSRRNMWWFLDRLCIQSLLGMPRDWPGARWSYSGHFRFQLPSLQLYNEVQPNPDDFKSVDPIDCHFHLHCPKNGHVMGKLYATGIGVPVDREFAVKGPRPMWHPPLQRRAPRQGELGPRRQAAEDERKRKMMESYKRGAADS